MLIVDPVDEEGVPVPRGSTGAKLLVTVLFSRTLPLIRYELSDSVTLGQRGCPCGRSFIRMEGSEGRLEDVLEPPGRAGFVSVHPVVFHHVLDQAAAAGWRVVQEHTGLRVLVAGLTAGSTTAGIHASAAEALAAAGAARTPVCVSVVDRLERTPLGKAAFVRRLKP